MDIVETNGYHPHAQNLFLLSALALLHSKAQSYEMVWLGTDGGYNR